MIVPESWLLLLDKVWTYSFFAKEAIDVDINLWNVAPVTTNQYRSNYITESKISRLERAKSVNMFM